ncbi:low molecular weight protein tyrosine phosphatase family protein [Acaryochloris sp. CCMEE 5410]|uniref:low molecular weight protein tyrosine phosphatase family protein n=1 Tax=Acaryochloris sp. CCMEE 5410 TaxID=310037 RepID=UPI00024840A7|nr:protein-tyrosine-phosphatase [Acaryochloris sp. CCMEE 5410]KAI9133387.1 phosphotyrosine protein phosphatase [Acaryochloris sp. CCMEE 5410]
MLKILFVCSRNQWRSPTAEQVWKNYPGLQVRSAGTSPKAKRTLSMADLRWADLVLVMEKKHKNRILAQFKQWADHTPIHILDIPDDYQYMDPDLVEHLQDVVSGYVEKGLSANSSDAQFT